MAPRTSSRLTALRVERAHKRGMYADGGGLYLRVTEDGTKNWVFRYMLDGRPRWMGLGPLALYGLREARAKALDARKLRHEGPIPNCRPSWQTSESKRAPQPGALNLRSSRQHERAR